MRNLLTALAGTTISLLIGGMFPQNLESAETPEGFCIYLLNDASLAFPGVKDLPLNNLELAEKPWIASADIEIYDRSCHCLSLTREPDWPKRVDLHGTPFVALADGRRCYLGTLWTSISSFLPEENAPTIQTLFNPPESLQIDLFRMNSGSAEEQKDPRDDARIWDVLKRDGKLHEGLACALDRVEIQSADSGSTVTFTYTITNRDADALYVFDPDKMSTVEFFYFTNGVSLRSTEDPSHEFYSFKSDRSRNPEWKNPPAFGEYDEQWFTRLAPGESMTRTTGMDGYLFIPPGEYDGAFRFRSPDRLTRIQRQRSDGRVWIGEIVAALPSPAGNVSYRRLEGAAPAAELHQPQSTATPAPKDGPSIVGALKESSARLIESIK